MQKVRKDLQQEASYLMKRDDCCLCVDEKYCVVVVEISIMLALLHCCYV